MNLQLADGKLENPIGILEDVALISCGIEYTHSFAVVDFGRDRVYPLLRCSRFWKRSKLRVDLGKNVRETVQHGPRLGIRFHILET